MDKFLKFLIITLLIMLFCFPVNAHQFKISHDYIYVMVSEPSWMNTSYPIGFGINWKGCSISYERLWSEVFSSSGHRLAFEYMKKRDDKLGLYGRLELDHYIRSNQGGFTIEGGIEYKINDYCALRIGSSKGWLTGKIKPLVSIIVEVGI